MASADDHLPATVTEASADPERTGSYHGAGADAPAPQTTAGAGPTLGSYELLEPVRPWQGGTIYAARHVRLHRTVQMRVLQGEHAADPAARSAFARSAQALAQLTHSNLSGSAKVF